MSASRTPSGDFELYCTADTATALDERVRHKALPGNLQHIARTQEDCWVHGHTSLCQLVADRVVVTGDAGSPERAMAAESL